MLLLAAEASNNSKGRRRRRGGVALEAFFVALKKFGRRCSVSEDDV